MRHARLQRCQHPVERSTITGVKATNGARGGDGVVPFPWLRPLQPRVCSNRWPTSAPKRPAT